MLAFPAMIPDDKLREQLGHTLQQFDAPALGELYRGRSATTTRAATGS